MAVIEYDIEYVNGKATVTHKVVEVDKGDRIRFKSNYKDAGIKYKGGSPFAAPNAPEADTVFRVGKGTTPEFTVTKRLTADNRLLFDCGEVKVVRAVASIGAGKETLELDSWGAGEGTPVRT